jgi:hypothetical protein
MGSEHRLQRWLLRATRRWNVARWQNRLGAHLERPSYVVAVLLIGAANAFFPFLPVELFLILRVLVRPREWLSLTLLTSVVSAIGNIGLARLVDLPSQSALVPWLTHHFGPTTWGEVTHFVRAHGTVGLGLVSFSFFPLPPAVVMCALSKVSDWEIGLAITVGHCIKYGLFARVAAEWPRWFEDAEQNTIGGGSAPPLC